MLASFAPLLVLGSFIVPMLALGVFVVGRIEGDERSPIIGRKRVAEDDSTSMVECSCGAVSTCDQVEDLGICSMPHAEDCHWSESTREAALTDVLSGAEVLADGEAVDAYISLSGAVSAYLSGFPSDIITDAAWIS